MMKYAKEDKKLLGEAKEETEKKSQDKIFSNPEMMIRIRISLVMAEVEEEVEEAIKGTKMRVKKLTLAAIAQDLLG